MGHTQDQAKYDSVHTIQFKLKYNLKTDAEIIEYLRKLPNKQGKIRELIKKDIESRKVRKYVDNTTKT